MTLQLTNTLTGKKEVFKPIRKGHVRIYTCGPTVYDRMHIGHARTYGYWDILIRYLKYKGYNVFHVQNLTDVGHLTEEGEDKVEKRARKKGEEPMVLAEKEIQSFFEDMRSLNIQRADISPRATGHIIDMIGFNKRILENGYAYESNGNLYFDVHKFNEDYTYAKMAGMNLEKLQKTERVKKDPNKKHPEDFALWLKGKKEGGEEHLMKWKSPWSVGYPGWHIECCTMSTKYLGVPFDIHCGGKDHIFPHHPNERAQTLAAFGKEQANYWLHANFLSINEEEMSKSKGNIISVKEAVEEYGAETIRLWIASSHYRREVEYSKKILKQAENKLDKIYNSLLNLERAEGGAENYLMEDIKDLEVKFKEAMDNDLNTPMAVSHLFEFINKANKSLDNEKSILKKAKKKVQQLGKILGLALDLSKKKPSTNEQELLNLILELRQKLREKGEYELSDEIRTNLKAKGYQIRDTDKGQEVILL